jgi:cycloeucalenol cycloisomerase
VSLTAPARRSLYAHHPAKAAVERWYLLFTPVWSALIGGVMLSGLAERWGDLALLTLGLIVACGAVLPPILLRTDRDEPWWRSTAARVGLAVTLFAHGLNYTQTPFFFDVLHMHYGFQATLTIDRNPYFLYLVSTAYFATYFALCTVSWRWLRASGSAVLRAGAWLIAPFAVALVETLLNANPFMRSLFCYDDLVFMSWFGTLAYGLAFVLVLPVWARLDELGPGEGEPVIGTLAALYADLLLLDLLRHLVAPQFTTVMPDAPGLRDFGNGCLVAPAEP